MRWIFLLAALLFSLCVPASFSERIRVSVSIPPLAGVARAVGGNEVSVTSFMAGQDDPHTFSPTPRAVRDLGESGMFVTIGVDFERPIVEKVGRMFPQLRIVNGAKGLDIRGDDHHHHGHAHVHDPHVWLSIPNLIRIATNIRDALSEYRPERKDVFSANLERLKEQYGTLHAELARKLKPFHGQTFYVYHPAFGYFARDYGLKQQAVEIDGKSPSPKQLLGLIKRARRDGVHTIFVQPQFSNRPATILADRIDGRVIALDPLAEDPLLTVRQAADAICGEQQ